MADSNVKKISSKTSGASVNGQTFFIIMVWRKVLEFGKYDTFHPMEIENKGIDG